MWGTFLSEPLSIVGLVGRYPANCLMERMPIYQRWIFNKYSHAGPLFYGALIHLSMSYSPLIGKLHTRYSPVRRSPAEYCYSPMPLDLHVLSLSLAFILSQDQTLRCWNCLCLCSRFRFSSSGSSIIDGIHSKYLYYCCICNFLKELFSIVSCETWCKGKDFYFYLPNFFEVFFSIYFSEDLRADIGYLLGFFQPHPLSSPDP